MALIKKLSELSKQKINMLKSCKSPKEIVELFKKDNINICERDAVELFSFISNGITKEDILGSVYAGVDQNANMEDKQEVNTFKCQITNEIHLSSDLINYSCNYYSPACNGCYMYKNFKPGCHHCENAIQL